MKKCIASILLCLSLNAAAQDVDIDFSRVGYMWGEKPIPQYENKIVLDPPADGADATAMIQEALNKVKSPGAVLLKKGLYNVSGKLNINRDGVVLRGEGNATIVKAVGTGKRALITIGRSSKRQIEKAALITDKKTPAGQLWVKVDNPSAFKVGDRITVCMSPDEKWISGLKMDVIARRRPGLVLKQWTPEEYIIHWERTVVAVKKNKIHLDNPIVMELDLNYMEAIVYHTSQKRVTQSGVENILLESEYDPGVTAKVPYGKYKDMEHMSDEQHSWDAIDVRAAEHCWVKGVTTKHFAYALVNLKVGAKNITVKDCVCTQPISYISGGRRYAYCFEGGELCLIENCRAEHDRHGFVTGAKVSGPNVFVDCESVHAYEDIGPHHRWATGVLYDNCTTDHLMAVQDRGDYGSGHGWAGVSFVFWNCSAETIVCQNPWISGKNWCVGCVGKKLESSRPFNDNLVRPDGEWVSHGKQVEPKSLYRSQLASRKFKITSVIK